jgi:hypothetical protein
VKSDVPGDGDTFLHDAGIYHKLPAGGVTAQIDDHTINIPFCGSAKRTYQVAIYLKMK